MSSFLALINFACAPASDDSVCAKSVKLISPLSNRDLSFSTCLSKRSTFNWLNSRFLKLYPKNSKKFLGCDPVRLSQKFLLQFAKYFPLH